jgi:hypothetical protein
MPYTSLRDFLRSSEAWGIIVGGVLSILEQLGLIQPGMAAALKVPLQALLVYVCMRLTSKTVKAVIKPKPGA